MLTAIEELYKQIYAKLKPLSDSYESLMSGVASTTEADLAALEARKANLAEQLEKIEDYREQVEAYIMTAEKVLKSRNHSTIVPRELNFNKLRNWSMMIGSADPDENGDDPYARRIHYLCLCNRLYLDQKQQEFEHKLEMLERYGTDVLSNAQEKEARDKAACAALYDQILEELGSDEFNELSNMLKASAKEYSSADHLYGLMRNRFDESNSDAVFGRDARPLPIPVPDLRDLAAAKLENCYSKKTSSVLMPVFHPLEADTIMSIACGSTRSLHEQLFGGIQAYLLNVLARSPFGSREVYVLDGVHYNNRALGYLKSIEGSMVLRPVPKSSEEIEDVLKEIVSSFADIDETLGLESTVAEFNASAPSDERIPRKIVVAIGYPSSFSSEAKKDIERILYNYDRYGITLILADIHHAEESAGSRNAVREAVMGAGAATISMKPRLSTLRIGEGGERTFSWNRLDCDPKEGLPEDVSDLIRKAGENSGIKGTIYSRQVKMDAMPEYERGARTIKGLPFGVTAHDQLDTISFDNENFATYLMGASGSGKSSLLHTLITGIMLKFHPDDVELWLADFKMAEFAQYMDPLPPHVKYILLDESPELVFDLIDKLTEEMLARQRYFMRTGKKFEDTQDVYMPMIMVILDEFSIMSQAVADSEAYKLKLQNLLAKGRALGFKFIFSSQTFTKGVRGLTPTAKDQIQTRIAMKNSIQEITETLELSTSTKTDQVKAWMEALPPHYTLTKYRDGEEMRVKRLRTMYFEGEGAEAFDPIRSLVQMIRSTMTERGAAELGDDTSDVDANSYACKNPVIVDGNTFKSFEQERDAFKGWIAAHGAGSGQYFGDERFISIGTPRLMDAIAPFPLCPESSENILLISSTEQACAASVIRSVAESFILQGGRVSVVAHGRDRLYVSHHGVWDSFGSVTDVPGIAQRLRELADRAKRREATEELVVMLGTERLLAEFEFFDEADASASSSRVSLANMAGAVQLSDEESAKLPPLRERLRAAKLAAQKAEGGEGPAPEAPSAPQTAPTVKEAEPEAPKSKKPNPRDDFFYLLRNGSRTGRHLLLVFNSPAGIRQNRVSLDYLRHRISFAISPDDSAQVFSKRSTASELPEHICVYSDTMRRTSFRPYVYRDITWDDWILDDQGRAVNFV